MSEEDVIIGRDDLAAAAAEVDVVYLDELEEMRSNIEDVHGGDEEEDEEEEEGEVMRDLDEAGAGKQLAILLGEEVASPQASEEMTPEPTRVQVAEVELGDDEAQVVVAEPLSRSPPPQNRPPPPEAYAAPEGAKRQAPTVVRIGQQGPQEHRARRMTLAMDLDEYKSQLEKNDLQSKKTQSAIKGIRGLVSKKKKRFIDSKYDLDLAYITDRLIAMGFPSQGREGIIRNPMSKVQQFFEERHRNHYKVYNLCSERTYKSVAFKAPVAHFGFDDHNPPTLEQLDDICRDVTEWLEFDEQNVAALHCKAGKGRTGTVICAYLANRYRDKGITADKALDFFAERRTHNKKGVTIAAQIRWVHYYDIAKRTGLDFTQSRPLFLRSITLHGVPNVDGKGGFDSHFVVTSKARDLSFASKAKSGVVHVAGADEKFTFDVRCVVDKDVKLQFYKHDPKEKKEKLNRVFHVWFNTHFIEDNNLVFTVANGDIDGIKKTKKLYPSGFAVEFVFEAVTGDQ